MGFWIFMMIMNAIIPLMMIVFGRYFAKNAPKTINYVFGYRTNRSMKNKDTWAFAHHYFGRLWHKTGWVLLIASVGAMLLLIGRAEDAVAAYGGIVCSVQVAVIIISIFPTEQALKKTFDENGFRRNEHETHED